MNLKRLLKVMNWMNSELTVVYRQPLLDVRECRVYLCSRNFFEYPNSNVLGKIGFFEYLNSTTFEKQILSTFKFE